MIFGVEFRTHLDRTRSRECDLGAVGSLPKLCTARSARAHSHSSNELFSDMYQNQNGISICFPSQSSSQKFSIELGPWSGRRLCCCISSTIACNWMKRWWMMSWWSSELKHETGGLVNLSYIWDIMWLYKTYCFLTQHWEFEAIGSLLCHSNR